MEATEHQFPAYQEIETPYTSNPKQANAITFVELCP